jgi:hypothetical protein
LLSVLAVDVSVDVASFLCSSSVQSASCQYACIAVLIFGAVSNFMWLQILSVMMDIVVMRMVATAAKASTEMVQAGADHDHRYVHSLALLYFQLVADVLLLKVFF